MYTTLLHKIKKYKILEIAVIGLIFFYGISIRTKYFAQGSKDISAYTKAISMLKAGQNPYSWTIESYSNPDDPTNHGFAYLPTMLYVNTYLLSASQTLNIDFEYLWKVPVLLADIGIGIFLLKKLKEESLLVKAFSLSMWYFNPYAYFRGGYTYFDPITIFLMLISLHYLQKDNLKAGLLYALSISTKTFPYLIFPVFVIKLLPKTIEQIKSKENIIKTELAKFLLAGLGVAILISLPFLRSFEDFMTYLNGSIFIHSGRFVQGRPVLYYISYYGKIEFFRIIPFTTYTLLASFSGWLVLIFLKLKNWVKDRYVMSIIPFLGFYLFTPVFNRTYIIWFIPLFVLGTLKLFENKRILFYVVNILFYVVTSWYLIQWEDGFHIWHPI
jgi:hypothetical protein